MFTFRIDTPRRFEAAAAEVMADSAEALSEPAKNL
jgi:hypothetical protein